MRKLTSRLGQSFLFFLLMLSEACTCPGGKIFNDLSGERIAALKSVAQKLNDKQIEELARDLKIAKEFIPHQIIIKFKDDTSASKVQQTLGTLGANKIHQFKSSRAMLLNVPQAPTKADIIAIITALNEVDSVDYAVPNGILKVSTAPNDSGYPRQDNLKNTGQRGGTSGVDIHAEEAWRITRGSKQVLVGVIDTGIDYLNPDLAANIWTNPGETGIDADGNDKATNGVDDDGDGFVDDVHGWNFVYNTNDPMDDYGHGTHVAGIIGAVGNNDIGITGINWNVSLVPLKFLDDQGSGTEADAIRAIEYASMLRIPITNNSWGGLAYNPALKDAIEAAGKNGMLFLAAAGNNSVSNETVNNFPSNYNLANIISVAAVDNKDFKASFSNWGASNVHIAAPGVNILSLAISGSSESLVEMSGTSMATPQVTGAAALIKAAYPNATTQEIKSRILSGADRVSQLLSPQYTYEFFHSDGYPIDKPLVQGGRRLNLARSLMADTIPPGAISDMKISFYGLTQIELNFKSAGDDGDSGEASDYLASITPNPVRSIEDWSKGKIINASYIQTSSPGVLRAEVSGLDFLQKGFVTIRAVDKVGNLGPISASVPFELSKSNELLSNDAESTDGIIWSDLFSYNLPFGREEVEGMGKVWSDSPRTTRTPGEYYYMEFPYVTVSHPDAILQFKSKLDCDIMWDRAFVDYLINDETDPFSEYSVWNTDTQQWNWFQSPMWRTLVAYSAPKCGWSTVNLPLRDKLKPGDRIKIRFWFKGMGTTERDGWLIDDIKILEPSAPEAPTAFIAKRTSFSGPYQLEWQDNGSLKTRFEIYRAGTNPNETILYAQAESNINKYMISESSVNPTLRVRTCNGIICSSLSAPIRVIPDPPMISSISPASGPLAGGGNLTLYGQGFAEGLIVKIGGNNCSQLKVLSSTTVQCTTPAGNAGSKSVSVIDSYFQSYQLSAAYTYAEAPIVRSISPNRGGTNTAVNVVLSGSYFQPGLRVTVGGVKCNGVRYISSNQIGCVTPQLPLGSYEVRVTNADGQVSALSPASAFSTIAPRWISTRGGVCSSVCAAAGFSSLKSIEGATCTSGEVIPSSAVGKVRYYNGCWPNTQCGAQGLVNGAISVGKYCYGPKQTRDNGAKDQTMGCFCGF